MIISGVYFQIDTCFSRQNPYAHWVHACNFNESQNNITNSTIQYCRLKCDTDNNNFITGLLIPDVIIVLLSFWIHFGSYVDCFIHKCQKKLTVCISYLEQENGEQENNEQENGEQENNEDKLVLECTCKPPRCA